ncbi:hypothetical protein N0V90_002747 [Kalmusia sp. IMI 367209]|nr:hypothetical protein N0V90_002747 [Kalmusia sp. IMI 367209]
MLRKSFPWTKLPLVVSAPMLGASTPHLAVNVSRAGGLGFIAGGNNPQNLNELLHETTRLLQSHPKHRLTGRSGTLPIGVGFQLFNCILSTVADVLAAHKPAAVWLFAPKVEDELRSWATRIRAVTNEKALICVQVGSVAEAEKALDLVDPDFLVLQGADAGGHGRCQSASIVSLVPEVIDRVQAIGQAKVPVLAAGGIADARGAAAALALGASGVVMGTRFLAAEESGIALGWKRELIRTKDGGATTLRSTLCDRLKRNHDWPKQYDGRAIKNQGHADEQSGLRDEENVRLYEEGLTHGDSAWGVHGRMVMYAGTGVGLVKQIQPAARIVNEIREGAVRTLKRAMDVEGEERL